MNALESNPTRKTRHARHRDGMARHNKVRRPDGRVHFALTIAVLCLFMVGCSSTGGTSHVWRASEDNGDKPGIGIEIERTGEKIRGAMYLLDPKKPHDFGAGSPRRMEIHQANDREIRFAVQWLATRRDEMVLRFASPLSGRSVRGTLESAEGDDPPRAYQFARVK